MPNPTQPQALEQKMLHEINREKWLEFNSIRASNNCAAVAREHAAEDSIAYADWLMKRMFPMLRGQDLPMDEAKQLYQLFKSQQP